MEMFNFARPEKLLNTRPIAARCHTGLAALAVAALAVGLASGCKQQASVQQPAARTDQQIGSDVQAKIQGESALAGQNIQVSVANGVATLSGTVSDDASRALAGNDSGTVSGVRTVVNNLTVQQAAAAPAPAPAPKSHKETRHERMVREQAADAPPPPPISQPVASAPPPPPPMQAAAPLPPPPAPPAPPKPVVRQYTFESGTTLPVILTEALSSKDAQPNDVIHATLASDLMSDGVVAVPRGTPVLGRVVDVKEAAHFKGSALLTIELTELSTRSRRINLVTDTYSKEGEGRGKNTAVKAGGGAALGAIIGAIAGGGKGAAIGAAAGAGAGTGVNAVTRGEQAEIPSETRLEFQLQAPITVTVTTPTGRMEYERPADPQLQQR